MTQNDLDFNCFTRARPSQTFQVKRNHTGYRIVEDQRPSGEQLYYGFAGCQQEGELFGIHYDNIVKKYAKQQPREGARLAEASRPMELKFAQNNSEKPEEATVDIV